MAGSNVDRQEKEEQGWGQHYGDALVFEARLFQLVAPVEDVTVECLNSIQPIGLCSFRWPSCLIELSIWPSIVQHQHFQAMQWLRSWKISAFYHFQSCISFKLNQRLENWVGWWHRLYEFSHKTMGSMGGVISVSLFLIFFTVLPKTIKWNKPKLWSK